MPRDLVALIAFIESRAGRPHDWTGNCCVRFAFAGVAAQFGSAPKLRVSWKDQRGARRAIAKVGGIAAEMDRLFETIDPAQAKFGDIAGIDDPEHGLLLAIVEGRTLVGPGEDGLERRPRSAMVFAWSAEPAA